MAEDLGTGHEIKNELVLGSELVQQQDMAFSMQDELTIKEENLYKPKPADGADAAPESSPACPGEVPRCNRIMKDIKEQLHVQLHKDEKLPVPKPAPECSPIYPGDGPCCNGSIMDTMQKLYSCSSCNKHFMTRAHLYKHRLIHKDETHICNICNKQFKQKCLLITHTRKHTGEKPYSCEICNKRFTIRYARTRHMRIHTGEKPFRCDMCDTGYTKQAGLSRHIQRHHNTQVGNPMLVINVMNLLL